MPSNEEFDDNLIHAARDASKLAYKYYKNTAEANELLIEDLINNHPTTNIHIIEFEKEYVTSSKLHKEPAGCLIITDDTIFVAYRGTSLSKIKEVYNDSRANQIPLEMDTIDGPKDMKIHEGFLREFLISESDMIVKLSNYENENRKIVFCGHSLGGATASIAALKLASKGKENISCITFGTPKVFSKETAQEFDKYVPCIRINDVKDPIPNYPIARLNYGHAGVEILTDAGHSIYGHAMGDTYTHLKASSPRNRSSTVVSFLSSSPDSSPDINNSNFKPLSDVEKTLLEQNRTKTSSPDVITQFKRAVDYLGELNIFDSNRSSPTSKGSRSFSITTFDSPFSSKSSSSKTVQEFNFEDSLISPNGSESLNEFKPIARPKTNQILSQGREFIEETKTSHSQSLQTPNNNKNKSKSII